MDACTEERFLRDVEEHAIHVIKDDGVHRHLSFHRNSSIYRFDLITWPGHLCISGDCGTYVFRRLNDMFEFFRMDEHDFNHSKERKLNINPGYWGEKLESIGTNEGYKRYSQELMKAQALEYANDYWEFETDEQKTEVMQQLEDDVFYHFEDNEYHDYHLVDSFESDYGHQFTDFWDYNFQEYTFHFLWNLYAIVYGIKMYDELKKAKAA